MELVAYIGEDAESWGQVAALVNRGTWEKIVVVRSNKVSNFVVPQGTQEIIIDPTKPLLELKNELTSLLKSSFSTFEACLSIASGNGKEHMALIAALLSIPVGIRLVAYTKNGVEFIN